jgi:peptidoglycan/xylan/chitin deacetylase (PgdA/CDA1 family)
MTNAANLRSGKGLFVASLDFELYWGMRHHPTLKAYIPRLVGARAAVPALLNIFQEYSIHATWATVGFLFFDQTRTLLEFAPKHRPKYRNRSLDPYSDLPAHGEIESDKSIFFAPSLIRRIADTVGQEVGTHTFSHYYCLEEGQDIETFREDLLAARASGQRLGIELRSLVFPQNEFQAEYIQPCRDAGITSYRGNPPSWIYREASQEQQGRVRRLGRLVDTYLPLTSGNCHSFVPRNEKPPVNVTASRFLRPYSRSLSNFEELRFRRIANEMTTAAKEGFLYHLWWHPHNFGLDTESNLMFLRKILDHYRVLNDRHGFTSANMGEVADLCLATRSNNEAQLDAGVAAG